MTLQQCAISIEEQKIKQSEILDKVVAAMPDSKFLRYVEKKVRKTIKDYNLFSRDQKIGVAVSGGKDSTIILYILKQLGYNVEGITINAQIGNYTKINLENIKAVCKKYEIALKVIDFREEFGSSLCHMKSVLNSKGHKYASCMLCGILKRYLLNKCSRKFKFDVLVTGHNMDDEAQAFIMNVFRNDIDRAIRQGPKPGVVKSKQFIPRVKPLYRVSEAESRKYSQILKFPVSYEICPCSTNAYRREFLNFLNEFERNHPSVKNNIIKFQELFKSKLDLDKISSQGVINLCKICGEPSSKEICRVCEVFENLKEDIVCKKD